MQVKLENRHYGAEQNKYKQTVITQWQGIVRNDYLKGSQGLPTLDNFAV